MKKVLLILLLCLITTSTFAQWNGVKPMLGEQLDRAHQFGDPVAAWFFLEGSGNKVFDLSGNGLNGDLIATAHFVPSKFGPVITVDGDSDYIDFINSIAAPAYLQNIGNSNNYSFVCWIKTAGGTGSGSAWYTNDVIIELRVESGAADNHVPFNFGVSNNSLALGRTNSDVSGAEEEVGIATINDGLWHQAAFVVIGDTVSFYIDGVLDVSRTFTTATGDCSVGGLTANMQMGCRARDNGTKDLNFFVGELDIPVLYNRDLSASEIAQVYREPFCMFVEDDIALMEATIPEPPPVGGQVILITKAAIPFILVLSVILIKRRKAE